MSADAGMDGKTRFTGTQSMPLKKFFASAQLQRFDFERALIDQMVPFDRDALTASAAACDLTRR
jgi:hypothetical protein